MFPNPQSTTSYSNHIVLHIAKTQLLILCFAVIKFQMVEEKKIDLTMNDKFVHF